MQLLHCINKAKNNDRQAQTLLYQQFKVKWFTICLRYLSNRDDANDVLQNALIKIFAKLDQFDPDKGDFSAWSCKVVVNENLIFLRANNNKTFFKEEIEEGLNVESSTVRADDLLSGEEITKLIQQLPDGYRMVFNLFAIEGFSHIEISKKLNISVGTSKSQLSKARKLLQKKLAVIL